jgi:hypothetical protein
VGYGGHLSPGHFESHSSAILLSAVLPVTAIHINEFKFMTCIISKPQATKVQFLLTRGCYLRCHVGLVEVQNLDNVRNSDI